nr:methyltransferase type 11 [uncultured Gammaproteobacteria bacterium]
MEQNFWNESELERLNRCPICESNERDYAYPVDDWHSGTPGTWDYYRCRGCGVFYLDPRPNRETIGRLYESYFTHMPTPKRERGPIGKLALGLRNDYLNWKYGYRHSPSIRGGRWFMYVLPPWLRWEWDYAARHLPKPTPGRNRLLDVGCGNGEFLAAARSAGWEGVGVDFDPKAVETTRSQGIDARLGSLEAQGFENSSFDAITLSHVIEHVHDPKALLAECARLLRPGGMLWIATDNTESLVYRYFGTYWYSFVPQHLTLFSQSVLRDLLEPMGFDVKLEHRGAHIQAHWRASAARKAGLKGSAVSFEPFVQTKLGPTYQLLELLVALLPRLQGDIVLRATKVG